MGPWTVYADGKRVGTARLMLSLDVIAVGARRKGAEHIQAFNALGELVLDSKNGDFEAAMRLPKGK